MATFTRASKATYINKQGVLVEAGIDEPRFEREGILIEGASTNIEAYSGDITSSGAFTVGDYTSRFGIKGKVGTKEGAGDIRWGTGSLDNSKGYTFSQFIKVEVGNVTSCGISCHLTGETPTTSINSIYDLVNVTATGTGRIQAFGNGLFRISNYIPPDSFGAPTFTSNPLLSFGNTGDAMWVGGLQIEELPFASSYVPTNGTPVTRASDNLIANISAGDAGTISFTASSRDIGKFFEFTGSSSFRAYRDEDNLLATTSGNLIRFGALPEGATHKITLAYSLGGALDVFLDGVLLGTSSCESVAAEAPLFIGSSGDGGQEINGHIRNFRIWNHALTAEQTATL